MHSFKLAQLSHLQIFDFYNQKKKKNPSESCSNTLRSISKYTLFQFLQTLFSSENQVHSDTFKSTSKYSSLIQPKISSKYRLLIFVIKSTTMQTWSTFQTSSTLTLKDRQFVHTLFSSENRVQTHS